MRAPSAAEILRSFRRAAVLATHSTMRARRARRLRALRAASRHGWWTA